MRVAIIGTGLVGGSLGLALRKHAPDTVTRVVGYDAVPEAAREAAARGVVDEMTHSPELAVRDADVVVLAVPVSEIPRMAATVGPMMRPGAILTDVGSVKAGLVEAMQRAVPDGVHVVGGHPMAGSAETGAAHASHDLFVGATYLLTPTTHTDPGAYERLHVLVARLGARVLAVSPEQHDALVAVVSHLPQLAASTLMNLAAERARKEHAGLLLLAAGGFRDATRVAASNPDLWLDICAENRDAIVAVLADYERRVRELREVLQRADDPGLRALLSAAREARRGLPGKETPSGDLVELSLPIPDRPGVLAEVTTTVGGAGVNIEDFGIEHSPEGGRGRLRMAILGAGQAETARAALEALGYEASVIAR